MPAGTASSTLSERAYWRLTRAERATPLIDGAAYFAALAEALRGARHSVLILSWDIHSEIILEPDGAALPLNRFLAQLVREQPGLTVRILVWDWVVFFSLDREFLPGRQFRGPRRLRFRFDSHHPTGACQHEKLVVIDGRLAFCGGLDLSAGRWDTPEHRPDEPHRRAPRPFHDGMLMVEGETARALEELARERWQHATGERLDPAPATAASPWPAGIAPWFEDASIAISRTRPRFGRQAEAREIEPLFLEAVALAERTIYLENQYLTVPAVAEALAARLAEDDGPEIVIVSPDLCEGFLETRVMDRGRDQFCKRLRGVGQDDRLRIMYPVHEVAGHPKVSINLHAKLMVVDDRLLIIGSANLERIFVPGTRRRRLQQLALEASISLVLLLAFAFLLRDPELGAAPWMREALSLADTWRVSFLGIASVLAIYLVASLFLVPVNLLIAATAAAFGPLLGLAYALAGALAAASMGFGLGRLLGRHPVRRLAGRRVNAVRRRLTRHGLWAMTLLRLLPIAPFTIVNLVAGTAAIRFREFFLGSVFGMLPGSLLLVIFGDRLGAWLRRPDTTNLAILVGVTFAVIMLALLLGRWARRRQPR
jgi:phosphatidylserine/phosphatidylglycerophosphate/cardiolipin synthase-like enzyme/uncharacterized membrane protein YdjX (TVP38/TMEM64 family)